MIIRFHPSMTEMQKSIKYSNRIINGSEYTSFEELLIGSDAFITDYSGTLFQSNYILKETYIYASDYKEYVENSRGIYFTLSDLGIPIAKTNEELVTYIYGYKNNKHIISEKMNDFNSYLGYYDEEPDYLENVKNIVTKIIMEEPR